MCNEIIKYYVPTTKDESFKKAYFFNVNKQICSKY